MLKHILVTGGTSGIGLALCKLLVRDHGCYVYLGSIDQTNGVTALKKILQEVPDKSNQIEVIQIDVLDDQSCVSAAKTLEDKGVKLYALVNNAGIMYAEPDVVINTNFKGPKRVTDALIGLIDKSEGRIVNISSGSASMWLRYQDSTTKFFFTNPDISFEDLEAKGGLISESFSLWLKSPKNGTQITSHDPEHLLFMWIVLRFVIWHPFLWRFVPK